jgi:hypothetical protein
VGSTGWAGTPASCHGGPTVPDDRGWSAPSWRGNALADRDGRRGNRRPAADGNAPCVLRTDHGQVALPVGAVHPHAGLSQPGQQPSGGVAVRVVRADRDQRHPGAGRGEEVRVGVAAPVVRHLQHVGAQVRAVGDDPRLGLSAEVAGEQDPQSLDGDPDDHGEVVGLRARGRPFRHGGQHFHLRATDRPPVAGYEDGPLSPAALDERLERLHPVVGRGQRAGGHDADVPARKCSRQAGGMVGVEMGHQHQRQRVDTEPVQAAVDGADVRTGVDQDSRARARGQHEGVTLTHVAGDRDGVRRWPAPHRLPERPAQHNQAEDRGQCQRTQPPEPPQRPAGDQEQDGQQDRAGRPGRPARGAVGHVRRTLRDQDQPSRRPAGAPDQGIARGRQQCPHERGGQTEDGRDRDRGRSEQVGGEGDEADRSGETGDDRRGHRSGRRTHGERIGQRCPAAALPEAPRPAGSQQDDAGGGGDGESEARVPGQPRVDQEKDTHRCTQGRQCRARAAGSQRHEGDRTHGRRAHDARAGTGQEHESDQGRTGDDRLHSPVDRAPAERPERAGQHDGDVRSRHRGEVRQSRAAEVLLEHRIHRPGVAHHETRQQARS